LAHFGNALGSSSFFDATAAKHRVFARETKEPVMRKLLLGTAAIAAAAIAATPAAAQVYISLGHSYGSPYSYGYSPYASGYSRYGYSPYASGYSPYGYGYAYPSYGYSYPSYGYGYRSYNTGYSPYGYAYQGYSARHCLRKHHRNGVYYYTRVC
jgi:hypothetical protein